MSTLKRTAPNADPGFPGVRMQLDRVYALVEGARTKVEHDADEIEPRCIAPYWCVVLTETPAMGVEELDGCCPMSLDVGEHDPVIRRRLIGAYEELAGLRALGYKGFATYERGGAAPAFRVGGAATSPLGGGDHRRPIRPFITITGEG